MPQFKRTGRGKILNRTDNVGTVGVLVRLIDKSGKHVKGNLMRHLTIRDAKVSDVFAAIERMLDN